MLETLKIKNLVVIDQAEIPFRRGLNILSGETGAGKSIVIEAISLILGGRASADLVRAGCDEAVIEGLFDLSDLPWMKERLSKHGFDDQDLLIKRIVHRGGRHRIYVNGELATLSLLQELAEGLVDLCGQHEHQSLLKPSVQLELLDRYGGLIERTHQFGVEYSNYKLLYAERDSLEKAEKERNQRADFLKFQIEELEGASLTEGEDETLTSEKQLLQSGELRAQAAQSVSELLEGTEGSSDSGQLTVIEGLRTGANKLKSLLPIDPKVEPLFEGLERAIAETEEVALAIHRYLKSVDLNSERLGHVQDRLSLMAELKRKYGATVTEMLSTLSNLQKEFSELGSLSSRLDEIHSEIARSEEVIKELARALSKARATSAKLFAKTVTDELKDLKMSEAKFEIECVALKELKEFSVTGADAVQFLVQTNRGEPERALGKIASGGELSRLMLAIRRVIADRGGIGVYLFDEIDAGIGGQTAFEVGKKLKSVAAFNQVICITHLPQVASFAHHHLSVVKRTLKDRTVTEVIELTGESRKEELARMLGGPSLSARSLENAAELLEIAAH